MEATLASHGVRGLVFLKLDILKLSKEVFEVDNVITTKRTKMSAFTLFQTSSPLFFFGQFAKIILGLNSKGFYQILEQQNRCLVFTYPIKLELGRFTSYSCSEFADN